MIAFAFLLFGRSVEENVGALLPFGLSVEENANKFWLIAKILLAFSMESGYI